MNSFIDMHMHSTASDGKDSPSVLLGKIRQMGIRCFSVTDHDTIDGTKEMEQLAVGDDSVHFIRGIEFSCITPISKCHILGYSYDWDSGAFIEILEKGKTMRCQKLEQRLMFLRDKYGIVFSNMDLTEMRNMGSVGKPHMADLMVKMGLADSVGEAITKYINGCPTMESRLPANEVIDAIHAANGISVWAHPLGGVGEQRLGEELFHEQLKFLMDAGLKGLECHYSRYNHDEIDFLVNCANKHGLYISGGSDYHGRKDYPGIGTLNAESEPIQESEITIMRVV